MRIAVVCAFNPNQNTGMCTVDRSAKAFFSEVADAEVVFLTLGDTSQIRVGDAELEGLYRPLQDDETYPNEYDLIVFWGDFLHSHTYWMRDLRRRLQIQSIAGSDSEAYEIAQRFLMLEGASDDILSRVVIFSSTTIADDLEALVDMRYVDALRRLLKKAAMVRFRDPLSGYRLSHLSGRSDTMAGCDAAMLHAWRSTFREKGTVEKVGYYFLRSGRFRRRIFYMFMKRLKRDANVQLRWIQWSRSKPQDAALKSLSITVDEERPDTNVQLSQLAECDFVISDVYHVCVNAWANGVPAVCIGHGAKREKSSLGSKKKELLFMGFYGYSRYLFWEEITPWNMKPAIDFVMAAMRDQAGNRKIFNFQTELSRGLYDALNDKIDDLRQKR